MTRSRSPSPLPTSSRRHHHTENASVSASASFYAALEKRIEKKGPKHDGGSGGGYMLLDPSTRARGLPHGSGGAGNVYHLLGGSKPAKLCALSAVYNELEPRAKDTVAFLPPINESHDADVDEHHHVYHTISGEEMSRERLASRSSSIGSAASAGPVVSRKANSLYGNSDCSTNWPTYERVVDRPVWLHGNIDREQAERLLERSRDPGSFLVREKDDDSTFALSVRGARGQIEHHLIRRSWRVDGRMGRHMCLNDVRLRDCFSLQETIAYLRKHGGGGGELPFIADCVAR